MKEKLLQIVNENREEVLRRRAEIKETKQLEYQRKMAEYLHVNKPVKK